MEGSSSRWRFMNPLEWFKWVYEVSGGERHPAVSFIMTVFVFSLVGAVIWRAGLMQHQKSIATSQPQPTGITTGNVTVSGSGNLANSGNGNKFTTSPPPAK